MKALRTVLAVMVICLLAVSIGCSKKKTTEPVVTTPTSTTTTLPTTQQATVGAAAASNVSTSVSEIRGMSTSLTSGSFTPKGAKTPPTNWVGPDASGWYKWLYNGTYGDSLKIRFTPDIWASGPPYSRPGKVEYRFDWNQDTSYSGVSYTFRVYYNGMGQYTGMDTLATTVLGTWAYGYIYTYSYSGYTFDYTYLWNCSYDNCSIVSGNHSMHFTYTCKYPFYDYESGGAGMQYTDLAGELSLDSSGYGNLGGSNYAGYTSTNGTVFVKYYYTSTGNYYTLLSENWATQHPFGEK